MEKTQRKKKKLNLDIYETITQEEFSDVSDYLHKDEFEEAAEENTAQETIKVKIKRKGKTFIDKHTCALWRVEDFFIDDRKAKGNSAATINYYERGLKKFNIFLATEVTDIDGYEKLLEMYDTSTTKGLEELGKMLPISVLEMDNLTMKYREFLTDIEELNPKTVNTYLTGYRVFMYYCMENAWIEEFKIPITVVESPLKQTYTDAEIKRLLKKPNVDNFTEYRNWVIINWFIGTGNRVSSVCDLKVKDIDLAEGEANINRTKNREPMRIPLVTKLKNIIREYIYLYRTDEVTGEPLYNQYLFCNMLEQKLTEQGLKKAIANYNKSRGVSKTSCHLFRHTFCKDWIMRGGDLFNLQKMLGHKSLKMVAHYANLYTADTAKKAEEFSMLSNVKVSGGKKIQRKH